MDKDRNVIPVVDDDQGEGFMDPLEEMEEKAKKLEDEVKKAETKEEKAEKKRKWWSAKKIRDKEERKALKKRGWLRKQKIEKFRFNPKAKNVHELVHVMNNDLASRGIEGVFVVFKGKEKNKKMTKRMNHSLGLVLEDIFKKSKNEDLQKAIFVIV